MAQATPDDAETVTLRLTKATTLRLAELALASGQPQSSIAEEALNAFCDLYFWQHGAIQEGLEALERGEVLPHEDVKQYWESKRAHPMD